tara:strand:+ start:796 stop:939 length:144 start_codon:yes stop_codon:yes gene_type:complete
MLNLFLGMGILATSPTKACFCEGVVFVVGFILSGANAKGLPVLEKSC